MRVYSNGFIYRFESISGKGLCSKRQKRTEMESSRERSELQPNKGSNMQNYKEYDYIIGIDPGVNTGIAVWNNRNKSFFRISTFTAIQAELMVRSFTDEIELNTLVRFEDARLRTWFGKEKGVAQLQGAGSIKRDCHRWEEFLTHYEIPFEEVAPKNNRTKMSANEFKRLTGWEGKTNEHGRDAAMLVFGL